MFLVTTVASSKVKYKRVSSGNVRCKWVWCEETQFLIVCQTRFSTILVVKY